MATEELELQSDIVETVADDDEMFDMVIEPSRGWVSLKLRELWEYRELLYFLTRRDIKVCYKQTALGAA